MRTIPNPATLRDAVSEVVQQNKAIGYNPTGFIQATVGKDEGELIRACDNLMRSESAFGAIWAAVTGQYPELLTLEDLVVHSWNGNYWGFAGTTTEEAETRVKCLDESVGCQRWGRDDIASGE